MKHTIPSEGLKGAIENWRNDLIAALSVALVALPLGLGVALASGMQPMAGVLSAIIGGLVTTFIRGGHVTINGSGAGLIAAVFVAIMSLNDLDQLTFKTYPNPANDILNISASSKLTQIEIYSILGRKVLTKDINTTEDQINISNLTKGVYIIKTYIDNAVGSFKFIKN